jgi:hypothetical protein
VTDADKIWNRAVQGTGGEHGDDALAALLVLHGTVMNGGLVNALETLDEEQVAAAVEGYRYFGFDEAADLIVETRIEIDNDADPGELEETRDGEFFDLVDDDETVYEAFTRKLADDPAGFAPVH